MLYTGKGDGGTTTIFGCKQRISKNSSRVEALGALDELNSLLGISKVLSRKCDWKIEGETPEQMMESIQQNLFIIQAELAGAEKTLTEEKLRKAEKIIGAIEKEIPPLTSFSISGGTELSASFDYARAVSRRAERRVILAIEEEQVTMGKFSRAYLNRLSSLLFALARVSNTKSGISEKKPSYS